MLAWIAVAVSIFVPTVAFAQETTYAPITLDQQSYNTIITALSEIKYKDVAAIIQYLAQMEQRSQAMARIEKEKHNEETNK